MPGKLNSSRKIEHEDAAAKSSRKIEHENAAAKSNELYLITNFVTTNYVLKRLLEFIVISHD